MEKYLKQSTPKELGKMVRIAKAAAKLFNEKGYLETSMEDISTAAKLSKGGIYHYFSSKSEMLYFISTNYMDHLLKGLEQELKKIDDRFLKINTSSRAISDFIQNIFGIDLLLWNTEETQSG